MLLLLTGTIDPSVFNNTNVKITAAQERLEQYVDSIKKYIDTGIFENVVFVENSGAEFPLPEIQKYAQQKKQKFELVQISTDVTKTIELGKSYGEADCIEQGLMLSELAKEEEYFVKCTGRVFVRNIDKLCGKKQCVNKFLFRDDMDWCYTLIFQMNIQEYKDHFFRAKQICDERVGIDIEKAFYKIIMEDNIRFKSFRSYPNVDGVCGTTGTMYNEKYVMKNFFTKLGLFSHNPFNKFIYKTCAPTFLKLRAKLKK
ncbi:MAG: hypothetical protein J6A67_05720 [Clostridia bacterium]|nr:hypothetical protein [Clostridia bacterium]